MDGRWHKANASRYLKRMPMGDLYDFLSPCVWQQSVCEVFSLIVCSRVACSWCNHKFRNCWCHGEITGKTSTSPLFRGEDAHVNEENGSNSTIPYCDTFRDSDSANFRFVTNLSGKTPQTSCERARFDCIDGGLDWFWQPTNSVWYCTR